LRLSPNNYNWNTQNYKLNDRKIRFIFQQQYQQPLDQHQRAFRLGNGLIYRPFSPQEQPINAQEQPLNLQEQPLNLQEQALNLQEQPFNAQEQPLNLQERLSNPRETPIFNENNSEQTDEVVKKENTDHNDRRTKHKGIFERKREGTFLHQFWLKKLVFEIISKTIYNFMFCTIIFSLSLF
jgi:hypothetical protein